MRLRTMQAGPAMQIPVFLILFLAPVYVPLDLLTGWIHGVASVNPLTALLEAGRGFISGNPSLGRARVRGRPRAGPGLFGLWALRRPAQRRGQRGLTSDNGRHTAP